MRIQKTSSRESTVEMHATYKNAIEDGGRWHQIWDFSQSESQSELSSDKTPTLISVDNCNVACMPAFRYAYDVKRNRIAIKSRPISYSPFKMLCPSGRYQVDDISAVIARI